MPQKFFFNGPAKKWEGRVRAWPIIKRTFYEAQKTIKKNVATKLEEGGEALVARSLKKDCFAASLRNMMKCIKNETFCHEEL